MDDRPINRPVNRTSVSIVITSGVLFFSDPGRTSYRLPESAITTALHRMFTFQNITNHNQTDENDGPPEKKPVRIGELRLFNG